MFLSNGSRSSKNPRFDRYLDIRRFAAAPNSSESGQFHKPPTLAGTREVVRPCKLLTRVQPGDAPANNRIDTLSSIASTSLVGSEVLYFSATAAAH
jgi:hypothetical protein